MIDPNQLAETASALMFAAARAGRRGDHAEADKLRTKSRKLHALYDYARLNAEREALELSDAPLSERVENRRARNSAAREARS